MKDPGKTVLLKSGETALEIPELSCTDYEEADTRLFAHVAFCAENYGCSQAVIQATDTDVIVMGIYHSQHIPGLNELWIQKTNVLCHVILFLAHWAVFAILTCVVAF